jgi:hypothetical protein
MSFMRCGSSVPNYQGAGDRPFLYAVALILLAVVGMSAVALRAHVRET